MSERIRGSYDALYKSTYTLLYLLYPNSRITQCRTNEG